MLFPLLILLIFWWTNTFLNLMGLTLSEAGKIDQEEANKFGEELGTGLQKIRQISLVKY